MDRTASTRSRGAGRLQDTRNVSVGIELNLNRTIYPRRTIDEEVIDRISGSETNLLLVVHSKANSRMNIAYRHPCCIDYPT
jgi:hypothetical protein